jgi:hypothetical protein
MYQFSILLYMYVHTVRIFTIYRAGLGIVDLHSIENDVLSLSSYFRGWFHDSGTDSEHLHLILPPATRYLQYYAPAPPPTHTRTYTHILNDVR